MPSIRATFPQSTWSRLNGVHIVYIRVFYNFLTFRASLLHVSYLRKYKSCVSYWILLTVSSFISHSGYEVDQNNSPCERFIRRTSVSVAKLTDRYTVFMAKRSLFYTLQQIRWYGLPEPISNYLWDINCINKKCNNCRFLWLHDLFWINSNFTPSSCSKLIVLKYILKLLIYFT